MAYCDQDDITNLEMTEAELLQLTDDEDIGSISTDRVTAAIAKADAEIDAYCSSAYTVPFTGTIPAIITGWSATLSAFNLYRNRPKPSTLIDRYNKVMAWLSDVKKGNGVIPGVTVADDSLPGSTTDGTAQTFRKTQTDADGNLVGDAGTMDTW
jgi:phage gp36-like protein